MKKKIALFLSVLMIIASFSGVTAKSNGITVVFNNEVIAFDQQPEIHNGTTMVPIRMVSEKMGGVVDWDSAAQEVEIRIDELVINLKIGSTTAMVNGEDRTLLTAPYIKNGRTMVPVRFISENMGADVSWTQETQTVNISFDGIILNKITKDYPIIVIPGTLGTLPLDQFELLTEIAKQSTADSFTKVVMSVMVPLFETGMEKITQARLGSNKYYLTNVDGEEYYVDPFIDTYVPLFEYFEDNGLVYDESYFIFGYDSLGNPIEDSSDELGDYIEYVLKKTGAEKVTLIGHSQGSLIARDYIQDDDNSKNVNIFMSVGGPFKGSMEAYKLTTGSAFGSMSRYDIMATMFSYIRYGNTEKESKIKFVEEYINAVFDMNPIYDKCFDDVENEFLEELNSKSATKKLSKLGAENVINIIGIGTSTDNTYGADGIIKTMEGDGTVAAKSAELGDGFKNVKFKGYGHAEFFMTDSRIYDYFDFD